jgi:hypothetical protein
VDESSFNIEYNRKHGYGKVGEKVHQKVSGKKPKRESIIGIRNFNHKIEQSFLFQGTLNADLLIGWFELIIHQFPKGSVFVIDNARAHHNSEFLDLMEDSGLKLCFYHHIHLILTLLKSCGETLKQSLD